MVRQQLINLLIDRFGCDGEIELATSLDDLNLYPSDVAEIALWFGELYGVDATAEEIHAFETVEDIVGHIEDRMG